MSNIFNLNNVSGFSDMLNIDDLYEKKKQYDLNQLGLFNKILNRIHIKIKTCSRQHIDNQYCWFIVPEMIIGVPKFDQGACIAYLIDKLKANGFLIKYIHPNLLFISWSHWVPSYVRTELKKNTGIEVNEYGKQLNLLESDSFVFNDSKVSSDPKNANDFLLNLKETSVKKDNKPQKEYTPIDKYKPSGKLIYEDLDLFKSNK
jgi:hypothetical protein